MAKKKKAGGARRYKSKAKVVKIIVSYPPGSVKVVVIKTPAR